MMAAEAEKVSQKIMEKSNDKSMWFLLLAFIVVSVLSVSNDSFWIDEMTCKRIAMSDSVKLFFRNLVEEGGSDSQMPVFQIVMFLWNKVFGDTEWGFRMVNVLFWLLGVWALHYFFKSRGRGSWGVIFEAGTSAFLWFYMNEARPYVMQFSGASCLMVGYWLTIFSDQDEGASVKVRIVLLVVGSVICAGSSLLGAPFAGLIFLCVIYYVWERKLPPTRQEMLGFVVWCVILTLLACYYGWTLLEGKGASAANQTSLLTLAFSVFEQLGFMPYGPGRLALRADGVSALIPWSGLIGLWGLCIGALLVVGCIEIRQSRLFASSLVRAIFPVLLMVVLLVIGGYCGGFRLLGRHFMPVYPVLLVVLGVAYLRLMKGGGMMRGLAAFVAIATLLGCIVQRFSDRHLKDDYRGAVAIVNSLSDESENVIWWAAGGTAPVYEILNSENIHFVANRDEEGLGAFPTPDMVVLSKIDLYDSKGSIGRWLEQRGYNLTEVLPAFRIYKKPPTSNEH